MTDAQSLIRAVNRAEEAHFILTGMSRTKRRGDSSGPAGTAESPEPISLDMLDMAEEIRASLIGWARIVHEETSDPLPRDDMPAWALYLREHALWIASTPWADDATDEIRDRGTRGIAMLGLFPRRTRLPEPCQCGRPQWVYHEDIAWTLCADGHVASLADALPLTVRTLSCAEAAMILGTTARTIERWVADGELSAASHHPTRISALSIKLRRVGLAARGHVA